MRDGGYHPAAGECARAPGADCIAAPRAAGAPSRVPRAPSCAQQSARRKPKEKETVSVFVHKSMSDFHHRDI